MGGRPRTRWPRAVQRPCGQPGCSGINSGGVQVNGSCRSPAGLPGFQGSPPWRQAAAWRRGPTPPPLIPSCSVTALQSSGNVPRLVEHHRLHSPRPPALPTRLAPRAWLPGRSAVIAALQAAATAAAGMVAAAAAPLLAAQPRCVTVAATQMACTWDVEDNLVGHVFGWPCLRPRGALDAGVFAAATSHRHLCLPACPLACLPCSARRRVWCARRRPLGPRSSCCRSCLRRPTSARWVVGRMDRRPHGLGTWQKL